MRILHLVLFSYDKDNVYPRMMASTCNFYKQYEKKSNNNHNVDTYYYYYDEEVKTITVDQEKKLLKIPGKETYIPGILDKTIEALRYFFMDHTKLYGIFDLVIRSNASTLINFEVLLHTLETKKQDIFTVPFYAGPLLQTAKNVGPEHGIVNQQDLPIDFITGTCIIMNYFTVSYLLQYCHKLERDLIDDLSIALFFKRESLTTQHNFNPKQIAFQFLGLSQHMNISYVSAFRNQNYMNREENVTALIQQVDCLTQRYFDIPKKPIERVLYHDKDITAFVLVLCKESTNHKWFISGNDNRRLDDLFGDPKPMHLKLLHLQFTDGFVFSQASNWCFSYDFVSKQLFVE